MATINKKLKQLRSVKKTLETSKVPLSPSNLLRDLKSRTKTPDNRGAPTKPITAEQILRAKKKSIARKDHK